MQRIVFGALAGLSATMAMTAAMRLSWEFLQPQDRYPLPPREIVGRVSQDTGEQEKQVGAVLAHFGFGALTGATYAVLPRWRPGAILYGLSVWTASYLGWIPALNILSPASHHPWSRNLLMIAAHVVWGATLGASLRELQLASERIFAGGPKWDATNSR